MSKLFLSISNHGVMMGGGEHSFLDLVSHLPRDWETLAVVPLEGDLASKLRSNGIPTRVVPLPSIRPWNAFPMISSIKSCERLCKSVQSRFIYTNGSRAAFYGGLVGHLCSRPVIWHCRVTGRDLYLDPIITRLTNVIIANSKATAERFGYRLRKKVRVVHNGVDLEWLREKEVQKPGLFQEEWKVILVVSRISKWKRHDLALAAFEEIASSDPKVHLVCVGAKDQLEPEWWAFLQERSFKSTFSNRIHWIGPVDDIRPWYRAASILLLPSMNEPFGRVLVESMALGVPVVAVRSGGVPEIVRHGEDGLLVTHATASEFGSACLRLLGDAALRKSLGESSKQRAEQFSLDEHVRKMVEIFVQASR